MSNNIIYAPAMINHLRNMVLAKNTYLGYDHSFWNKERSMVYWPNMLITYWHSRQYHNIREKIHIEKDQFIIGDSGGYEVVSNLSKGTPINIDPEEVLRWHESNCNIGLTLDIPPVKLLGGTTTAQPLSEHEFMICLQKSYDNNVIFESKRKNYDTKIYSVIHSSIGSIWGIEKWWDKMKNFDFDGYSIAPKTTTSPLRIILDAMYLHSKGVNKNLHVLGITGFNTLVTLAYLSRYVKHISTDSSSYGSGAIYKRYALPFDLKNYIEFGKIYEHKLKKLPCSCPVCSKIGDPNFFASPGSTSGTFISLHNLNLTTKWIEFLNSIKDDKKLLTSFAIRNCSKETIQAIQFMDMCVESGFDAAYKKYFTQQRIESWV